MGVGKFIILESPFRSDMIDTFEKRSDFDAMFNQTYNDITHALLYTNTITSYVVTNKVNNWNSNLKRENLLTYATQIEHAQLAYRDRLASFPINLKFVAKKMALYFMNNGISLEVIPKIVDFNPIVTVVIIAVLRYFLIETEYDASIFNPIYYLTKSKENALEFRVFFTLIDRFNMPLRTGLQSGPAKARLYPYRAPTYRFIIKAADQLSTMMGLSGFLNNESPQLNQVPQVQKQELINLLQDTSKKVRIYARIEDGPEPPPSAQVMSLIGSLDTPKVVQEAADFEKIRAMQSRYYQPGGKRRKSSNHTQRRKKNMKHSKKSRRRS